MDIFGFFIMAVSQDYVSAEAYAKLEAERDLRRDILEDLDVIMGTALHNGHHDLIQRTKEALQKIGEIK